MSRLPFILLLASCWLPLAVAEPVDFDTEVIPVLTRHGCNAGSCHGAASGRGGFKLSLLGSGAAEDYQAIARQLEGRRINLADPDRSLVLRKPSEQIGHEGGEALPEDSAGFATLHRWIGEGARRLQRRQLLQLQLSPTDRVLDSIDTTVPVKATAVFDDQTERDVTGQIVLVADDPDAVVIDGQRHQLTVKRRGVHVVVARYLDQVLPIRLTVPMHEESPQSLAYVHRNSIDRYVNEQLERLRLPVSPQTDDHQFLRRVTLDLAGRLPTLDEIAEFTGDPSSDRRQSLIDRLLESEDFAVYWALKWANVLQIDSKALQPEGAAAYHLWMRQRLHTDAPLPETVTMMLTGEGDAFERGAVNFLRAGSNPGELAEHASRVWMGVRLRCANCHNHPLDHWVQDDYHGLAAIFAKLERGRVIEPYPRGEVTHPVTGEPAVPRIPGQRYLAEDADGRTEFAQWLTAAETHYLPTVTVNRIWEQLMGRGLVNPVDDLRATNPASHPELLQWLATDFVDHGYRLKHTIATICNSAAYQRCSESVAGNESDDMFYSHALPRSLEAEVIADAIGDVSGIPLPSGDASRLIAVTDNQLESPSLDILGRCDRTQLCESTSAAASSLAQSLHLINGPLLNERLSNPAGELQRLIAQQDDDRTVIEQLYLRTLSRPPRPAEQDHWLQLAATIPEHDSSSRAAFFEDLLWSLLTSRAFLTNH